LPRILTTVPHDFRALTPERLAWWQERADVVDRRRRSRLGLVRELRRRAKGYDALLLDGSVGTSELYSDLVVAAAARGPAVVISDASWKRGSWWGDRLAGRVAIRVVDSPRVTYCVLSSAELDLFPRTWGVDPHRVVFTPFCATLEEHEPAGDDGSVFAGGESLRDYGPLLAAACGLPARVTIASSSIAGPTPENVVAGRVPHERFGALLRGCRVVVVPLARGIERSAGQQTYLNAMAAGKLVIVTDSPGARDYVDDGVTGLVVPPGDATALRQALEWCLDDGNAAEHDAMRRRAVEQAGSRFSLDVYFERLLAAVQQALGEIGVSIGKTPRSGG
jgi:hypothetical protein